DVFAVDPKNEIVQTGLLLCSKGCAIDIFVLHHLADMFIFFFSMYITVSIIVEPFQLTTSFGKKMGQKKKEWGLKKLGNGMTLVKLSPKYSSTF
ncbi:hypothetical protein ACJX0J_040330, partial [Zea mays]